MPVNHPCRSLQPRVGKPVGNIAAGIFAMQVQEQALRVSRQDQRDKRLGVPLGRDCRKARFPGGLGRAQPDTIGRLWEHGQQIAGKAGGHGFGAGEDHGAGVAWQGRHQMARGQKGRDHDPRALGQKPGKAFGEPLALQVGPRQQKARGRAFGR